MITNYDTFYKEFNGTKKIAGMEKNLHWTLRLKIASMKQRYLSCT